MLHVKEDMSKIHRSCQNTATFPSSSTKFIDYQILEEAADIALTAADEMKIWGLLFQSEKKRK